MVSGDVLRVTSLPQLSTRLFSPFTILWRQLNLTQMLSENWEQATNVIDEPEVHVSASGTKSKYTLIFEPKSRRAKWAFNVLQTRRQNSKIRRNEYRKNTDRTLQASAMDELVGQTKKELITPTAPSSTHFVSHHFSENLTQERRQKIM